MGSFGPGRTGGRWRGVGAESGSGPQLRQSAANGAASGRTGYASRDMRTEPSRIVTSGDGSGFVDNFSWTGWRTPTARGLGVLEIDNCTPNCAAGAYTGYRATVTMTKLVAYGQGKRVNGS